MRCQDVVNAIRHEEVYVLGIGIMLLCYSMYIYYFLLCIVHVLSLDALVDLLRYLSPSMRDSILAELYYISHTIGIQIRK